MKVPPLCLIFFQRGNLVVAIDLWKICRLLLQWQILPYVVNKLSSSAFLERKCCHSKEKGKIIIDNEKDHFSRLRTLHSQLITAKSHLDFFEKCWKHGIYPENLNVREHFRIAFNTPKLKKAYSDLNKDTRNEKINLCISQYKLFSGKIIEDIGEQKVRLTDFQRTKEWKFWQKSYLFSLTNYESVYPRKKKLN